MNRHILNEKLTEEDEEEQKSITIAGKTLAVLEKYYKKDLSGFRKVLQEGP